MRQADQDDPGELRPEYADTDLVGGVRGKYAAPFPLQRLTLALECSEQVDGGWQARILEFPDLSARGDSWESAVDHIEALATATGAARVRRGEMQPTGLNFAITTIRTTARHTPN